MSKDASYAWHLHVLSYPLVFQSFKLLHEEKLVDTCQHNLTMHYTNIALINGTTTTLANFLVIFCHPCARVSLKLWNIVFCWTVMLPWLSWDCLKKLYFPLLFCFDFVATLNLLSSWPLAASCSVWSFIPSWPCWLMTNQLWLFTEDQMSCLFVTTWFGSGKLEKWDI